MCVSRWAYRYTLRRWRWSAAVWWKVKATFISATGWPSNCARSTWMRPVWGLSCSSRTTSAQVKESTCSSYFVLVLITVCCNIPILNQQILILNYVITWRLLTAECLSSFKDLKLYLKNVLDQWDSLRCTKNVIPQDTVIHCYTYSSFTLCLVIVNLDQTLLTGLPENRKWT